MKYGILGTGDVAHTVGSKLIALGHEVMLGARSADNEKAIRWADSNGVHAMHGTFADAARFGERVFLCVRGIHSIEVVEAAGEENLAGKILIDQTNPYLYEDGHISLDPRWSGMTCLGEEIQKLLPRTKVVKTLNYLCRHLMTAPQQLPEPVTKQKDMDTVKLNNGVEMPLLGYGVFLVSPEECERCVSDALEVGYRHIDTAQAYFNEEGVGRALVKSGIPRDELFLTTKVWISNAGEEKAARSIDESLRKLQTDYIDLLLIHQPYGDVYGSWRAMEKALTEGKVRAIGVSNFQAGRFLDFALHVDVKPAMNQLQCNALIQQTAIQHYLAEFGTKMTAWGPLGGQGADAIFTNPVLTKIGEKYDKTASQVALRWLTMRGIVAIPKSTHKQRMAQNLDIFDFRLTGEEMSEIATLNQHDEGTVNFNDPAFIKFLIETYG